MCYQHERQCVIQRQNARLLNGTSLRRAGSFTTPAVKIGPSPAHGACANSHLRREALLSDHTVNRCATQSGHADDRRHAREAGPGVDVDGVSRFARLSHDDCPLDRDVHTLVRDIGATYAGFRLFSRVHTRHEEVRSRHESRAGGHAVIAIPTLRFTRRGLAAASPNSPPGARLRAA